MRHRALVVALTLSAVAAVAAVDRLEARARPAGPLPPIPEDTLAVQYDVGGVPVIQRRVPGGEVVAVRIYLLGGSRQITAANAGIEPVMLYASEYGTKNYPGGAARSAISKTGSAVVVGIEPDWTTFAFAGLAEDFDSTWAIVADRMMNPTLDSAAVAIAKQRALGGAASRVDGPDGIVRAMAESLAFAGHPYQNPTGGTMASLTSLTPAMVKEYHSSQMVSSRLVVVVAGNVSRAQVEGAVQKTLATLPKGTYKWTLPERWQPKSTTIAVRSQQLPTNYIVGLVSGPLVSSGELLGFQEALGYIGSRTNSLMRDSGLSYSAGAAFLKHGASGGMIILSTGSPDRAQKIINDGIETLSSSMPQSSGVYSSRDWDKQYLSATETVTSTVDVLGDSYLFNGDFRYFENYGNEVRKFSLGDMTRAARAYVKNIQWAYLGDTLKLPRAMMMKY